MTITPNMMLPNGSNPKPWVIYDMTWLFGSTVVFNTDSYVCLSKRWDGAVGGHDIVKSNPGYIVGSIGLH
jgi:hypothetical protein